MLVTSVVIRVTRLADENLSIFAKEKVWMLRDVYKRQLLVHGKRTSVPAKLAHGIIVDTQVIRTAPEKFIYSGIGDMVSKITALYDWIFEEKQDVYKRQVLYIVIQKRHSVNGCFSINYIDI